MWQGVLWGLFGAFAVDAWQFTVAVTRVKDWPWSNPREPSLGPYLVSIALRLSIGGGLAAATVASNSTTEAWTVVTVGVAGPYILEQLARLRPVSRFDDQAMESAPQTKERQNA
ncbi:hypothetical protein GCM10028775_29450 [Catellatospora paridis]